MNPSNDEAQMRGDLKAVASWGTPEEVPELAEGDHLVPEIIDSGSKRWSRLAPIVVVAAAGVIAAIVWVVSDDPDPVPVSTDTDQVDVTDTSPTTTRPTPPTSTSPATVAERPVVPSLLGMLAAVADRDLAADLGVDVVIEGRCRDDPALTPEQDRGLLDAVVIAQSPAAGTPLADLDQLRLTMGCACDVPAYTPQPADPTAAGPSFEPDTGAFVVTALPPGAFLWSTPLPSQGDTAIFSDNVMLRRFVACDPPRQFVVSTSREATIEGVAGGGELTATTLPSGLPAMISRNGISTGVITEVDDGLIVSITFYETQTSVAEAAAILDSVRPPA